MSLTSLKLKYILFEAMIQCQYRYILMYALMKLKTVALVKSIEVKNGRFVAVCVLINFFLKYFLFVLK